MYQESGFTLIELLVVVLIIGILAAVALPQYTVAVEKSRTMTLVTVLSALADAEDVYYLANGSYTNDLSALDIEPPAGSSVSGEIMTLANGQTLFLNSGGRGFVAGGTNHVQIDIFLEHTTVDAQGRYCYAAEDDSIGNRVCKSLGKPTGRTSTCGMLAGVPRCAQYEFN
ncbi:MAG: type IV pilin protein [Candidatus Avelusimicrobium sp.]|uniref:type IV pilin protein n=1 Tax=Candidatus Avelusimicrobium sp. TaxID=3048833 RepID=UPI003F0F78B0